MGSWKAPARCSIVDVNLLTFIEHSEAHLLNIQKF